MTAGVRASIDEQNPWPGLGAFDEAAERFFNGRKRETAELRRLVMNAPLTVLFSASGLGKTSLVQAGLSPALRKDNILPVYVRLDVRERSAPLIDQVTAALQNQIRARNVDAPSFAADESLWRYLHRHGLELWSEKNQLLTPLFIFDQFEEVFTVGADNPGPIGRLRADLADLIENRIPAALAEAELNSDAQRYKVLLSFREDFLAAVEGWKRDLPSIMRNRLRLLPMSEEQAFEAVHSTAPHLADENMARQIVRFVAAAQDDRPKDDAESGLAVEPALLSLVCHGLNERRKAQNKPSFDQALLSRTGRSIIEDYYAMALADMPERVPRFIEEELITERGFRKPCDVDDARMAYGVTAQELGRLVDRRLLRMEPWRGTERVELTHDLLTWVVREHRERRRERERLRRQRTRFAILGGIGAVLVGLVILFGRLYLTAERQRSEAERQKEIASSAEGKARAALGQAEKSAEGEKEQRVEAQKQADLARTAAERAEAARSDAEEKTSIATVQRMAAQADGALARFPQRSLALAVEAVRIRTGRNLPVVPAAEQSLRQALAQVDGKAFGGSGALVVSMALSPDNRWLAMSVGTTVYLCSLSKPGVFSEPVLVEEVPTETRNSNYPSNYPMKVAFSSDGHRLAAMAIGVAPRVWDLSAGRPVVVPVPPAFGKSLMAMASNDGRYLVGVSKDLEIAMWNWAVAGGSSNLKVIQSDQQMDIGDARGRTFLSKVAASGVIERLMAGMGLWNLESVEPEKNRFLVTGFQAPVSSPNGRWMAQGQDSDGYLLIDATAASTPPEAELPNLDTVTKVFSPDNRWLAIGGQSGGVRLLDLTARDPRADVKEFNQIRQWATQIVFSPDGHWMAASNMVNRLDASRKPETSVWLWNLKDPDRLQLPRELSGHEGGAAAIAVTPDSRWLVTGSDGGVVRLFDLQSEDPAQAPLVLRGHEGGIADIRFSKDSHWLVTRSVDFGIRLWDLRAMQASASPLVSAGPAIAVSPNARWLLTGQDDRGFLWDLQAARLGFAPISIDLGSSFGRQALFSQDSRWLVTAGEFNPVRLHDLASASIDPAGREMAASGGPIRALALSADSRWLVVSREFQNQEARLWDLKAQDSKAPPFVLRAEKQAITPIVFSPDSRRIALNGGQGTVRVLSLADKAPADAKTFPIGQSGPGSLQFSSDSKVLFVASRSSIDSWRLDASEARPRQLQGNMGAVSPDGRWLVTKDDRTTRLWDLSRPGEVPAFDLGVKLDFRSALQFTPNWLATTKPDRLWNLRAGNPAAQAIELRGHPHGLEKIVLSADGRWLATNGAPSISFRDDKTVRLWDLSRPDPTAAPIVLLGHERGVSDLAITPDSRRLFTAADDATVRIWDLTSPDPAASAIILRGHSNPVKSLMVTPDNRWSISSDERSSRLWNLRVDDLVSLAAAAGGRNLSLEEWELYFQGQPYRKTFPNLPAAQPKPPDR